MGALHPGHAQLSTDACVPLHKLPEVLDFTRQRCEQRGLTASFVGHVGDGNFHVLFQAAPDDAATWQAIHTTYDEMMGLTLQVGGTCTGEHGVGREKINQMCSQFNADELTLFHAVKAAFDPSGLLNPGKLNADYTGPTKGSIR